MMKTLSFLPFLVFGLAGCQAVPEPRPADAETRPTESGLPERASGRTLAVLSEASEVRIVVFPAGRMARLGHPHVVGGHVLSGEIVLAEAFHDSTFELEIAVDQLSLDQPEWRREEGFEPEMSESDIRATRDNMLSAEQLDAENHPSIRIESISLTGPRWQPDIDARITLAGTARELTVPVSLDIGEDALTATGRFVIRQSEFGIEPYSAAGGAVRVADEVLVRFRIMAE